MCGICGYIGDKVKENLIEKLSMLEYRGYDSCGIAYIKNNKVETVKSIKKIDDLNQKINNLDIENIGIGHTRWATHGEANEVNAHPHISNKGNWAVVHNGIIENYKEIKDKYLFNTKFKSQTDTEVIPNLLELNDNNIYSFISSCNMLKGSYAICAINKNNTDTIYLAKNHSPLYVAKNSNEVLCASDTYCFDNFSEYYEMQDGEFAVLKLNKIIFYDYKGKIVYKKTLKNKINKYNGLSKNFSTFMEKEINEIPICINNLIEYYQRNKLNFNFTKNDIDNIKIIACGSAYHTGLIGEKYLKEALKIEVNTFVASEFRYSSPILSPKTLCIFISQSGETADTIACLKLVKNKCKTLSIVNAENSTLRYLSKNNMFMLCGKEIAVATTKAFVNGVLCLYILANHLNNKDFCNIKNGLIKLKNRIKNVIEKTDTKDIVNILADKKECFFIGRDIDYPLSMEASLKLKEISYINTLSIASGELKHGTLALIDKESVVFASITQNRLVDKNLSNIKEIEARKGNVYVLTTKNLSIENKIFFKGVNEKLDVLVLVVFYQLLSLKVCLKKNLNPDKPRNLAKSVTVE